MHVLSEVHTTRVIRRWPFFPA